MFFTIKKSERIPSDPLNVHSKFLNYTTAMPSSQNVSIHHNLESYVCYMKRSLCRPIHSPDEFESQGAEGAFKHSKSKLMGEYGVLSLFLCIICLSSIHFACQVQAVLDCPKLDMEALLTFKNDLEDPDSMLISWKGTNCCEWLGIRCDNTSQAVTAVDLSRFGLGGNISTSLAKLESLTYLDLSLNTFDDAPIPEFFGSLSKLRYLNLSQAGFGSIVTPQLGNLSSLEYLNLSADFPSSLAIESLEWLTGCRSIKHISFDGIDMSKIGSNWLEEIHKLSQLNELHMSNCGVTGSISSLSIVNFTSLSLIDFSFNSFPPNFPNWVQNISSIRHIDMMSAGLYGRIPLGIAELTNLEYLNLGLNSNLSASSYMLFKGSWPNIKSLYLSSNKFHGKLPSEIGNITSLVEFDLFLNNIEGGIPSSIGRLCNLERFDLTSNNLTGSLPVFLSGADSCGSGNPLPRLRYLSLSANMLNGNLPAWLGQLGNLIELRLSYNSFHGPIPSSMGALSRLNILSLEGNNLNGTVPETIGLLSELSVFDLSSNQLSGMITEAHFRLMTNATILVLSSNSFTLRVGSNWVPPFQVRNLDLSSCRLDLTFPTWLKTQKRLRFLDLSNSSISGPVPAWFWDISANLSLLNISFNHLRGQLPNPLPISAFADVDLSSNLFHGLIPLPTVEIAILQLSQNRFTGPIPANIGDKMPNLIILSISNNLLTGEIPTSIGLMSLLAVLDLSTNGLSGTVPSNISNLAYLKVLDLSNNNLSGNIPSTIGQLKYLQSMHLNNDQLSGSIPPTIQNLSNLETLDLSHNALSGKIPPWLGKGFMDLRILTLRSNDFSGDIPPTISKLSSLDLAENRLTGSIPSNLSNLSGMAQRPLINQYLFYGRYRGVYYQESLIMNVKNNQQKYMKTLSLVTSIDLSSNRFTGPFPDGITNLSGLLVLNLSRKEINSHIPDSISQMQDLTSLDFSNNKLSGPIPSSISSLTFLAAFNVSNNNLSGKIPESGQFSTFNKSAFEGNPGLCGPPLIIKCLDNDYHNRGSGAEPHSKDDDENVQVYASVGVGFAVGLMFPIILLAAKKTWRLQYLKFVGLITAC